VLWGGSIGEVVAVREGARCKKGVEKFGWRAWAVLKMQSEQFDAKA